MSEETTESFECVEQGDGLLLRVWRVNFEASHRFAGALLLNQMWLSTVYNPQLPSQLWVDGAIYLDNLDRFRTQSNFQQRVDQRLTNHHEWECLKSFRRNWGQLIQVLAKDHLTQVCDLPREYIANLQRMTQTLCRDLEGYRQLSDAFQQAMAASNSLDHPSDFDRGYSTYLARKALFRQLPDAVAVRRRIRKNWLEVQPIKREIIHKFVKEHLAVIPQTSDTYQARDLISLALIEHARGYLANSVGIAEFSWNLERDQYLRALKLEDDLQAIFTSVESTADGLIKQAEFEVRETFWPALTEDLHGVEMKFPDSHRANILKDFREVLLLDLIVFDCRWLGEVEEKISIERKLLGAFSPSWIPIYNRGRLEKS